MKLKYRLCIVIMGVTLLLPGNHGAANAQSGEPKFEELKETFKKDYLSLGVLMQTVGDFQIERSFPGNDGFSIANFRLMLSGELDKGFGYLLQANFVASPALLDAMMYYHLSENLMLDVGLFKAPFSKEFLTPASAIDFVNRSQAVTALTPGRQIGVQIAGTAANDIIQYQAGLFNGNSFRQNANDNDNFLYAGRLMLFPLLAGAERPEEELEIGLSLAVSKDDNATLGGILAQNFSGDRLLLGGDVRWAFGKYLVSGELVYGQLDFAPGPTQDIIGWHATGGVMLTPNSQALLRLDRLDPDNLQSDSTLLIFGYNLWPTQATELQVNYIINTDNADIENHQILVNGQLGF